MLHVGRSQEKREQGETKGSHSLSKTLLFQAGVISEYKKELEEAKKEI